MVIATTAIESIGVAIAVVNTAATGADIIATEAGIAIAIIVTVGIDWENCYE
jgi:uncharacterized membrane protein YgaE (UPF0421/DUF939 family)